MRDQCYNPRWIPSRIKATDLPFLIPRRHIHNNRAPSSFYIIIYLSSPCPTVQIPQTVANKFPHSYRVKRAIPFPFIYQGRDFFPMARHPPARKRGRESKRTGGEVAIAASAGASARVRFTAEGEKDPGRSRGEGRIEGCLPSIQWVDAATLRLVDSPLTEFSPKSLGKSPPGCDLHCLHHGICTFVSERTNKQIFSPLEEKKIYMCIHFIVPLFFRATNSSPIYSRILSNDE